MNIHDLRWQVRDLQSEYAPSGEAPVITSQPLRKLLADAKAELERHEVSYEPSRPRRPIQELIAEAKAALAECQPDAVEASGPV